MNFQDQTLTCRDCGAEFVWTASEQAFYQEKGFTNPPVRCPQCRAKRKAEKQGGGGFHGGGGHGGGRRDFGGPRPEFTITCKNCGKQDTVPFKPRDESDVLCRDCFQQQRR